MMTTLSLPLVSLIQSIYRPVFRLNIRWAHRIVHTASVKQAFYWKGLPARRRSKAEGRYINKRLCLSSVMDTPRIARYSCSPHSKCDLTGFISTSSLVIVAGRLGCFFTLDHTYILRAQPGARSSNQVEIHWGCLSEECSVREMKPHGKASTPAQAACLDRRMPYLD